MGINNPIFSFIGSAIKNKLYKGFYQSLAHNTDVPFEVIFVGSRPPQEEMPSNFYYIFSKVKPTQCLEIAIRNSRGQFIFFSGDDLRFHDNFLSIFESYVSSMFKNNNVFFSSRYSYGGVVKDYVLKFDLHNPSSPSIGYAPCFPRDLLIKIGGIDRRFIGSCHDTDITMRMVEMGLKQIIIQDCIINELPHKDIKNRLFSLTVRHDRSLLKKLWMTGPKEISDKRLSPVLSFSDECILDISQGDNINSNGRWI